MSSGVCSATFFCCSCSLWHSVQRWSITALARAAEIQERTGRFEAAINTYQRIARMSQDQRWKKSARARIKLIQEKLQSLEAVPASGPSVPAGGSESQPAKP